MSANIIDYKLQILERYENDSFKVEYNGVFYMMRKEEMELFSTDTKTNRRLKYYRITKLIDSSVAFSFCCENCYLFIKYFVDNWHPIFVESNLPRDFNPFSLLNDYTARPTFVANKNFVSRIKYADGLLKHILVSSQAAYRFCCHLSVHEFWALGFISHKPVKKLSETVYTPLGTNIHSVTTQNIFYENNAQIIRDVIILTCESCRFPRSNNALFNDVIKNSRLINCQICRAYTQNTKYYMHCAHLVHCCRHCNYYQTYYYKSPENVIMGLNTRNPSQETRALLDRCVAENKHSHTQLNNEHISPEYKLTNSPSFDNELGRPFIRYKTPVNENYQMGLHVQIQKEVEETTAKCTEGPRFLSDNSDKFW